MVRRVLDRRGNVEGAKSEESVSLKVNSPGRGVVKLSWFVSKRVQADKFILERSLKDTTFETIKTFSVADQCHEYTDVNVPSGFNYYRIRVVKSDNSNEYRRVRVVFCS